MVANMKRAMVGVVGALVLGMICVGAATAPAQANVSFARVA